MASKTDFRFGDFLIRSFAASDLPAIQRIWLECGWLADADPTCLEHFFAGGHAVVADLDGTAESLSLTSPGKMQYLDEDLNLCAVTAVTTSHTARRRGLGMVCTAEAIASATAAGAEIAALGIFEQGYYDGLGFGNGSFQHSVAFDPADLKKLGDHAIPRRLTKDDWQSISHAMQTRWRGHGGCNLTPNIARAEVGFQKDSFGLGYVDDQGELSHFFFGKLSGEHGPLRISAIAYRNGEQLLELFSLLRSLGDQISCVKMVEPPHLHLQDLLIQPFRKRELSEDSDLQSRQISGSVWQFRILDIAACIGKTHLDGPELEFNLVLTDPVTKHLHSEPTWRGAAGDYTVYFGEDSSVDPGKKTSLPTLQATVNAFSRMWLGVRPATHLAISDELSGPQELLEDLDVTLRLPTAVLGWDF